jgi:cation:H+ antiporter
MLEIWTFSTSITLFVLTTLVLIVFSPYLTSLADQLADVTKLGEAFFGAIMLGCFTSLAGVITSISAAYHGYADLAVSNALGSIVIQTAFLGIADILYTRANLEHAAASLENILQGVSLVVILTFVVLIILKPINVTWLNVDPASLILLGLYLVLFKTVANAKASPMWHPRHTRETVEDKITHSSTGKQSMAWLWGKFLAVALLVAVLGYILARSGIGIVENSGLEQSFVGALFTGIASSVTELIVTIAAVRQGALTLAVSNIIGGNIFDVLFLAFSDVFYREGSIFKAVSATEVYLMVLAVLMTGILLLGLLYRQREGPAKIGWESVIMLVVFALGYYSIFVS